jgi:SulP family sulfate permease
VLCKKRNAPPVNSGTALARRLLFPSLHGFRLGWLPSDAVAGAMLAAVAIPEQLATAHLAGMPAQTGLYAFAAGSLVFAAVGANRYLSVGADSTIAPIFAGAIAAIAGGTTALYPELIGVAALFTGLALILCGVFRAGWIADLLSIPVTTGFLAGIAVRIVIGQLPLVLGTHDGSGPLLSRLFEIAHDAPHASGATFLIGAGVLGLALAGERISPRFPGALAGLVAAGATVWALHLDRRGVAVLGALPAALPHIALPIGNLGDWVRVVPIALIVALVCMMQTAVVLRSFPSDPEAVEDPSHDFAAVGMGSVAAALLGAFAVDASPPRTALSVSVGGRTQLTGIVAVVTVVLFVVLGARLAAYLPLAALGGVLIFIGMRIFRFGDILNIARRGGYEIWLVVAGALFVIVLPIDTGMLLAIFLSLAHGVYVVARPPSTELVRLTGTTIWWPPGNGPGQREPGALVFSPAAPIAFTNGRFIARCLSDLVAAAPEPVRLIVLEGSGISDIDYTGARIFSTEIARLRASGIAVAIARLADGRARTAAERTGLLEAFGPDRDFNSVHEALERLRAETL